MVKKPSKAFLESELKAAKAIIVDMLRESGAKDERLRMRDDRITELGVDVLHRDQQLEKLRAESGPYVATIADLKKRLEETESCLRTAVHEKNMAQEGQSEARRHLSNANHKVSDLEGQITGLERAIEIATRREDKR